MIEESTRPFVSVYTDEINTGDPFFYLVVKNFGKSTAYITKFEYDFDFNGCYKIRNDRDYLQQLNNAVLAPGQPRICTLDYQRINKAVTLMDELHSPITSIPGMGFRMAAMILAETGDFTRFDSQDKLLAYAGMSPSTYQSGQLKNCYPHMEKRGSRYLRYALYNATKYVCHWDPNFADYLAKKRAEGKHYNVALSHAAKKLVRLIFAMEKSRQPYCSLAA